MRRQLWTTGTVYNQSRGCRERCRKDPKTERWNSCLSKESIMAIVNRNFRVLDLDGMRLGSDGWVWTGNKTCSLVCRHLHHTHSLWKSAFSTPRCVVVICYITSVHMFWRTHPPPSDGLYLQVCTSRTFWWNLTHKPFIRNKKMQIDLVSSSQLDDDTQVQISPSLSLAPHVAIPPPLVQ